MLTVGDVLNERYKVLEVVSQGVFGITYKAEDQKAPRTVAIKEMTAAELPADELSEIADIFFEEIEYLKELEHQNVVNYYEAFNQGNRFYYVTEWIDGFSLDRILEKRGEPMRGKEVVGIFFALVELATFLHQQIPPYFFRLLKPSDIMVDSQGNMKVVDFSIALDFQPDVMPAGYIIPAESPDEARDIFFIGSVIYELVTGVKPDNYTVGGFEKVSKKNNDVSKVLADVIDKTVADRTKRYRRLRNINRELLKWFPEFTGRSGLTDEESLDDGLKEKEQSLARSKLTCTGCSVLIIALIVAAALILPDYLLNMKTRNYEHCCTNLTQIGNALEKFNKENHYYPDNLSSLIPRYIDTIPTCPAGNGDSYVYEPINRGRAFKLICRGKNHEDAEISEDYPRFTSGKGLIKNKKTKK